MALKNKEVFECPEDVIVEHYVEHRLSKLAELVAAIPFAHRRAAWIMGAAAKAERKKWKIVEDYLYKRKPELKDTARKFYIGYDHVQRKCYYEMK